jgi:Protein of unknown function (DUF3300)
MTERNGGLRASNLVPDCGLAKFVKSSCISKASKRQGSFLRVIMSAKIFEKALTVAIAFVASLTVTAGDLWAGSFQNSPATPVYASQDSTPVQGQQQPSTAPLTSEQLQQLVAPIALYPDALVAQILAASAYPTQIVEAERFLQQNPDLKGKQLGDAVDQQDWDPSVKALAQFPSVLANMDKNLTWTSELGDANANQASEVMDAVQFMRRKAQSAGNLKTTPQQVVTDEGSDVEIQPADPQVVYVPTYDPTLIYGYSVGLWPGFYPWWGPGPYISFGIGFGIGPFFGFGWGWGAWGFDWHRHGLLFGGGRYAYHSRSFYNRNAYFHGGGDRGGYGGFRGGGPYSRGDRGARGFADRGGRGVGSRPGAFGGVTRGGDARGQEARGRSSFGGGGFGGGGGFHGGGGSHGGGGRH